MTVSIRDGVVEDVKLRIYEPPRFFEALLRGRAVHQAADITARICGICPVAYQMTAARPAIEDACGVGSAPSRSGNCAASSTAASGSRATRCTSTCSTRRTSSATRARIAMAATPRASSSAGCGSRRPATRSWSSSAGAPSTRSTCASGASTARRPPASWPRWPSSCGARATRRWRRSAGRRRWTSPTTRRTTSSSRCRSPGDYPIERGRLTSSAGLEIGPAQYEEHFEEHQVPHSTALHSRLRERGSYLVGPLARYALNHERLSPLAREAAAEAGLQGACRNPFRSIVVRAVEILYAFDEALRIIAGYEEPEAPAVEVAPRAGTGCGWTEAPRGMLWHRYRLDEGGAILEAKIVPPTSQNQRRSRRICAASWAATPDSRTTSCVECASRSSATTTRASRVRRTSSRSTSSGSDPRRHRSRQRVARRRRRGSARRPPPAGRRTARRADRRARGRAARPAREVGWRGGGRSSSTPCARGRQRDGPPPRRAREAAPRRAVRRSTHLLGVADAIELGRALGRLPARLFVLGIEGERFTTGAALSEPAAAAVEQLVAELRTT